MLSVTPIGVVLLATGIAYFMVAGRYVLPAGKVKTQEHARATHTMRYFQELYGLEDSVFEVAVPAGSPLVGRLLDEVVIPPGSQLISKSAHEIWMRKTYGIAMLALHRGGKTLLEGDGIRDIPLQAGDALVVLGEFPSWVLMLALALLATFFSLVMSNVGATVLLVPLAVNIALGVEPIRPCSR